MTTNQQNKPPAPLPAVQRMNTMLSTDSVKERFASALNEHSDLFVASILAVYSADANLQKCAPDLVIKECLTAATLNLPINKSLGFAYIVPYNKKRKVDGKWVDNHIPSFQLGYKGYIQLAMRTGAYRYINADVVYEGELKSADKLSGAIDITGERTGDEIVGYFAYIETINGFKKTVYASAEDVEKHAKKYSQSYKNDQYNKSAWSTNFDDMALKTMLRKLLSKYAIMSVEMADAYDKDVPPNLLSPEERLALDAGEIDGDVIDLEPVTTPADEEASPLDQAEGPQDSSTSAQEEKAKATPETRGF
ncbi:MAG: recombinase RecT [Desulfobacteraceae bacterium]|nr:recombinase RecT [Desulfobacteraceae bacterium]